MRFLGYLVKLGGTVGTIKGGVSIYRGVGVKTLKNA